MGLLGGNTFGINTDDAYWTHEVRAPSLISQLDHAGISWKAYMQGSPHPGYQGICYPAKCNGSPDSDPLFVSKHDGIQNYVSSLNPLDWSRQVPLGELPGDLASGDVPRFNYVIPDECHDMHGDPPYCLDGGEIGDPQNQHLVALGDSVLGHLVSGITNAPFWAHGNNAIVVTYDEGDNNAGCCDATPGGGRVATIVITSHGPIPTPNPGSTDNHLYGVDAVARGDVWAVGQQLGVKAPDQGLVEHWDGRTWSVVDSPVSKSASVMLDAVTVAHGQVWAAGEADSPASGGRPIIERLQGGHGQLVHLPSSAGNNWTNLYGIAAAGDSVWAVGTFVDLKTDNNETLILRGTGNHWTVDQGPNPGSGSNILGGLTAIGGHLWAAGTFDDGGSRLPLVEHR